MSAEPIIDLTDRQARALIVAAEARGFERESELYVRWYDAQLHADAGKAVRFLRKHDADGLAAALTASDPVSPDAAGARIVIGGKINLAEMRNVIDAAVERGFVPPEADLPLMPSMIEADRARAAVAFLWEEHAEALHRLIGEAALLAPIPETARWPCRCYPTRDVDYY